jgi:tetratricopeptide (TPR) repeat protein
MNVNSEAGIEGYPPPDERPDGVPPRLPRFLTASTALILIVICVVGSALLVAALGGVVAGQNQRSLEATQTTSADLDIQFELGLGDLAAERYDLAAQRFRWVLERAPDYPGATDRLAQAEQLSTAASAPLPTDIPTSAAQTLDERFAEVQTLVNNAHWETAIQRLHDLEDLDPEYRRVDVQELLYRALTTLGLQYVRGERMEEGIFLLEQAQHIRPLDDQAAGELYFANQYTTVRQYWDLNWVIVIANLEAISEVLPNYRDVATRLPEAHEKYGDQLAAFGAQCDAADQYELALGYESTETRRDKFNTATDACLNPTATPTVTPPGFSGATPEGGTTTPGSPDGGIPDATSAPTATPDLNTIPDS